MRPYVNASPTSLSYVAALRGVKPRRPGDAFTYADVACTDPDLLICLAASNPEGQFYALMTDERVCVESQDKARARHVDNITFVAGTPAVVLERMEKGMRVLPQLTYLSCDESTKALPVLEHAAVITLAEKLLEPSGLLATSYRPYAEENGALKFLVREFGPEMNADQAKEFLQELKDLGGDYFAKHPEDLSALQGAIAKNLPDEFFDRFDKGEAQSGSFNTLVALKPRGFAYAGDGHIASNYIEMSVPQEAQDIILKCATSPLYEPIKDFALNRSVRSDIWCRLPAERSEDLAELFGPFTYGITMPREQVPTLMQAKGKTIDLTMPLFTKLIDLMCLLPASIGDFLAHPKGEGFTPAEVVGAIQTLIACGIAQPMRGVYAADNVTNVAQPRIAGAFNRYLDKAAVTGSEMWMASPVLGAAVSISARDALVIQALDRAGLANSVSALLPELQRLAKNPAQAARVMDAAEPTAETARSMIEDVVKTNIVQWYAYGLLEAA